MNRLDEVVESFRDMITKNHNESVWEDNVDTHILSSGRPNVIKPFMYLADLIPEFVKTDTNFLQPILPDLGMPLDVRMKHLNMSRFRATLVKIVVEGYHLVYMNENHPENWNVILMNISSMRMMFYNGKAWVCTHFNDWYKMHARMFLLGYIKLADTTELGGMVIQQLDEAIDDVKTALFTELTDFQARDMIKKRYGFR